MTTRSKYWACLLLLFGHWSQAAVINGDFSSGLDDWTVIPGDVTVLAQEARVADDGLTTGVSSLYQGVALAAGTYDLRFDFLGDLSSTVPGGTFPDLFSASLYFIDTLADFDLVNGVFDDVISLFDLDFNALTPLNGSAGSSPKGGDWSRWSLTFNQAFNFAIPTFETFDGNFLADSVVRIDNVSISVHPAQAPSPSSVMLLLPGLLGIASRLQRCRRDKISTKVSARMPAFPSIHHYRPGLQPSDWG